MIYYNPMDASTMKNALRKLETYLNKPVTMLVGGGAAMVLAYQISLSTMDIDGVLIDTEMTPAELDPLVKQVGKDLDIHPHWFDSDFDRYTYTVPSDYKERLQEIYKGKTLKVFGLGLEDLLIMKCFAGHEKDIGHAKGLIKKGAHLKFVDNHIESLIEKGVPGAEEALDFLEDIREQLGK